MVGRKSYHLWSIALDSGTIGLDQPEPLASIGKEVNMKELVRLRMRPSRNKKSFRYMLGYRDQRGKRREISLGHANITYLLLMLRRDILSVTKRGVIQGWP
jgi:hypothetical protein